jgi:hypothetical protein
MERPRGSVKARHLLWMPGLWIVLSPGTRDEEKTGFAEELSES